MPVRIALIHSKNILQNKFCRCFCHVSPLCSLAVANMQFSLCCRLPSLRSGSSSGFALLVDSDNWLHFFCLQKNQTDKNLQQVAIFSVFFFFTQVNGKPLTCWRLPSLRSGSPQASSDNWLHLLFFTKKKVKQKKRIVAAASLALIDAFWKSLAKLPSDLTLTGVFCFVSSLLLAYANYAILSLLSIAFTSFRIAL